MFVVSFLILSEVKAALAGVCQIPVRVLLIWMVNTQKSAPRSYHSFRKATTGSMRAALIAGMTPNSEPSPIPTPNASTTVCQVTNGLIGVA